MYMNSAYRREFPHLYRGIVEDNSDPQNLGRCKVRVPSVYGELTYPVSMLPWARPISGSPISSGKGSVNIPDVGDIVWVLFEGANKNYPVYLGGTYAKDDLSIDKDIVVFYTENSDSVTYNRKTGTYKVVTGAVSVEFNSREAIITGNTTINGSTTIIGDTRIVGNLHVTGDITSDELSDITPIE